MKLLPRNLEDLHRLDEVIHSKEVELKQLLEQRRELINYLNINKGHINEQTIPNQRSNE